MFSFRRCNQAVVIQYKQSKGQRHLLFFADVCLSVASLGAKKRRCLWPLRQQLTDLDIRTYRSLDFKQDICNNSTSLNLSFNVAKDLFLSY
jgi:hypothetical protein